jgi:hypothetical protein
MTLCFRALMFRPYASLRRIGHSSIRFVKLAY